MPLIDLASSLNPTQFFSLLSVTESYLTSVCMSCFFHLSIFVFSKLLAVPFPSAFFTLYVSNHFLFSPISCRAARLGRSRNPFVKRERTGIAE